MLDNCDFKKNKKKTSWNKAFICYYECVRACNIIVSKSKHKVSKEKKETESRRWEREKIMTNGKY